jgi:gamma-glutamyltranspeptidase / glutathione hydrolase
MTGFDHSVSYPSVRQPLFARNVVATSQPLASQAGVRMLLAGGNAVDAALATAIALTVVEPCSNGIGSDAFAIIWDGKELHGLNASGRSPQTWTPEWMRSRGHGDSMPLFGWDAVTVPGAVSAWVEMSRRFGRLPFADLFVPAIEYARDGFPVTPEIARRWALSYQRLKDQPGFADVFTVHGRTPGPGEIWQLPALAQGLTLIAESNGEEFYRGRIAEAIIRSAQQHGAAMSAQDLAEHRADWVGTISAPFAGHEVHEIPPNGQGITALAALGMMTSLGIESLPPDSAESQHLQIEAIKLAFADAYAHVSDADSMSLSTDALLNPEYLAQRAKLIDPDQAQEFSPGTPPDGGTVYLTAADSDGLMVSMIQSNYMGFGSGVVIPEYGISMQNRGNGFVMQQGHPNVVGPSKRPFHTIIPGFLTKDGQPVMSFGVMGGHMQPQGHAQTLVRMLLHGMHPQAACDAPRFRWNQGLHINAEDHFPAETLQGLAARGHVLAERNDSAVDFGSGQFIWSLGHGNGYLAATDPRSGGAAVGF